MIIKNIKLFKIYNKQMAYIAFAISFLMVNDIFAYQLFKKNLNKYLFNKNNITNI